MPTEKIILRGVGSRVIRLQSGAAAREITIVFADGEELPPGDLYATASSRGDVVELDVFDATGSDGITTVVATLDPGDLESFGGRIWTLEVGTLEEGSGDDATAYVMFAGSAVYRENLPSQIASTTIQEIGS
jgi:hypothetical protein